MSYMGTVEVLRSTVTLIDAQIKALPTTPVEIIPTPGPGKRILFVAAAISFQWAGNYGNMDGTTIMTIADGDTSQDTPTGAVNSLFTAGGDGGISLGRSSEAVYGDLVAFENVPMLLYLNNAGGNLTGGHANNTLKVTVFYMVVDV